MKKINQDSRLAAIAKTLFDYCDKDCDEKRQYMIPIWSRAEYYWNDIQDLFFDESIGDWRTFDEEHGDTPFTAMQEYGKTINSYRALGESVIAAASTGQLSIRFVPGDADNPIDIDKANAYSDISKYIQRQNDIVFLRRKIFKLRWTQGLVGAYTYFERDKDKYGTQTVSTVGNKSKRIINLNCPECDTVVDTQEFEDPEDYGQFIEQQLFSETPQTCPDCGGPLEDNEKVSEEPFIRGQEEVPKGCSIIELYEPLRLKVPFYATSPQEVDYVVVEGEMNYAKARSQYPQYAKEINAGSIDHTEATYRIQADYYAGLPSKNLVTVKRLWAKPSQYYALEDEREIKFMQKKYPDGVYKVFINNILVECVNMKMEDRWEFLSSPLDTHIYLRALGNGHIAIQDMENDLVMMTMDTIKHAIGETFFDHEILNQQNYARSHAQPGNMVPIEPKSNKSIGDHFFQTKNATLSREVDAFFARLESRGQLVTGAFPSIYGGTLTEGSKTLGVYQESRNMALQRVGIPNDDITRFLTQIIFKAVKLYDQNMETDETYAEPYGSGFRNVTLNKPSPKAKIARVEPSRSEQFPETWEQKRAFVFELLEKNNPQILAALFAPENIGLMKLVIGIDELHVPGEADRNNQLREIQELLKSEPIDTGIVDPITKQPIMESSIKPDMDIDNDLIHAATTINWLINLEGQRAKIQTPLGYQNVLLHLREHNMNYAAKQPQPQPQQTGEENGGQ